MEQKIITVALSKALLGKKSLNLELIVGGIGQSRRFVISEDSYPYFWKIDKLYMTDYYWSKKQTEYMLENFKTFYDLHLRFESFYQAGYVGELFIGFKFKIFNFGAELWDKGDERRREILEYRKKWKPYVAYTFALVPKSDVSFHLRNQVEGLFYTTIYLMGDDWELFDKEIVKRYFTFFLEDKFFQNVAEQVFLTIRFLKKFKYSFANLFAGNFVKEGTLVEYENENESYKSLESLPFAYFYKLKNYSPKENIAHYLVSEYNYPAKESFEIVDIDLNALESNYINISAVRERLKDISGKERERELEHIVKRAILGVALDTSLSLIYQRYQQILELFAELVYSKPEESFKELKSRLKGEALEEELYERKFKFFEENILTKVNKGNDCLLERHLDGFTLIQADLMYLLAIKDKMLGLKNTYEENQWKFAKEFGILSEEALMKQQFY
jgi:hypothetical protein